MITRIFRGLAIFMFLTMAMALSACSKSTSNVKEVKNSVFEGKLEKEPEVISESGEIEDIVSSENIEGKDMVADYNSKGIITAEVGEETFELVNKETGEVLIKPDEGYAIWSLDHAFCFEDGSAVWIESKLESTGFPDDKTWSLKYKDGDGKVTLIEESKGYKVESDTFNNTYPLSLSVNNGKICYSTFDKNEGKLERVIKLYDIKAKKSETIESIEDYKNKWFNVDLGKDYVAYSISETPDGNKEFGKVYMYSIKDKSKEKLETEYNLLHPQIRNNYLVLALKPDGENFITDKTEEYITKEFWVYNMTKKEWLFRVTSDSSIFEGLKAPGIGINLDSFRVKDNYMTIDYLGKATSFVIIDLKKMRSYNPEELVQVELGDAKIDLRTLKFASSDNPTLIWTKSVDDINDYEITKLK